MNKPFSFADFELNISNAIDKKQVRSLRQCHAFDEYIRILCLSSLNELFGNCVYGATQTDRKLIEGYNFPAIIANEIVRRFLIGLPKIDGIRALDSFLTEYFPDDPLLECMDGFYTAMQNTKSWFDEERVFLSELAKCLGQNTAFISAINRAILAFKPQEIYFANILVTVKKDKNPSDFKHRHVVDGLVRRICTYGTPSNPTIFASEANAGPDFEATAKRVQEYLRATGKIDEKSSLIQYAFMDDLAYRTELEHDGRSASLTFARLAYAYHNLSDNRLAPYIAFCGSLTGANNIEPVNDIQTKVRVAKENGIRIIILPEANLAEISEKNGLEFITCPSGNLGDVIVQVMPAIDKLHTALLGPKEAVYWDDFIEKSRKQHAPELFLAKQKSRYSKDRYVHRNDIESDFKYFIANSDSHCMVIGGESGRGKTYFLCNLCDKSIEEGDIVLFFNGSKLESDKFLDESIDSLKPAKLTVDSEDFIGIVNSTAEWQGKYFIISVDAINEAEAIKPEKVLELVEDFVIGLQDIPSERLRIFVTCRSEMWRKILHSRGFSSSEDKYYVAQDGRYVSLDLFTAEEGNQAINIYFGDKAKNLSDRSREMLRDPFLLRIAKDAYKDSDLPVEIFSWSLIDKYYESCLPDLSDDDRLLIVELLAEQMLVQKTDRISRLNPGDDDLKKLLDNKNKDYLTLIEERVISREDRYIKFPHDRFTEIHIAKALLRQNSKKPSPEYVVGMVKEAREFPPVWGALKLILIKDWDSDLIVKLAEKGDTYLNEFLATALIAEGRENRKQGIHDINEIYNQESFEAKKLALKVAYNIQEMDILQQAIYEDDEELSATAIQYIYMTSRNDVSKTVETLSEICENISLLKLASHKGQKSMHAALSLFLLLLPHHFQSKETIGSLKEIGSNTIDKLLGIRKVIFAKDAIAGIIGFVTRAMKIANQKSKDPTFNPAELSHFFTLDVKEKDTLLELLPYFKCERYDIESVSDIIIDTTKRVDAISNIYVMNLLSAQANKKDQWRKLVPIIRRIYEEGSDYTKNVTVWTSQEIVDSLYLSGDEALDEVFQFSQEITESAIRDTKGRFALATDSYSINLLYGSHRQMKEIYGKGDIGFTAKYVSQALEQKDDRKFLSWVLSNLEEIAIEDSFLMVRSLLQQFLEEAGHLIMDETIEALTNLKIHYPEDIEDLLSSLDNAEIRQAQSLIKGGKSRSAVILSRQFGASCGEMVKYFVRDPNLRGFYAEGWACAAKCKRFDQWIQQVFMKIINQVMGQEIYRVMDVG